MKKILIKILCFLWLHKIQKEIIRRKNDDFIIYCCINCWEVVYIEKKL